MIGLDLDKLTSLKVKVLGGIFLVFFLAIAMVIHGVLTYQRARLIRMNTLHAMQTGHTVVAGLSSSMLQNDRGASMEVIKDMISTAHFSRISVLNKDGKIVMTSEPSLAGKILDKSSDTACIFCHQRNVSKRKRTAVIESPDKSYIRTVIAIENKPTCYTCHPKENDIIGLLFVDSSLEETNSLQKETTRRILLTAIVIFLFGVVLINFIVTRYFTKPLDALQVGFEQVGRGNFEYWVDVKCGGEISDMVDSFNIVTRAIGRYVDEVKAKSNEVSTLYSIVQKMSLTIEKKKLKEIVADLLCEVLQADCVTLALPVEKQKGIFEILTMRKGDKRHYHSHFHIESEAKLSCSLTRDELVYWGDRNFTSPVFSADGTRLLLPLQLDKMLVGLISVDKAAGETFTLPQRKIIPVLAHHMTISFANAQLYELAITDELTGLYTKRHFLKKIKQAEKEYLVRKKGFSVMMIDVDHFKYVNDSYGHPVGDRVLAQIGELLMANVRHGDTACRYGGEEFVVLLNRGDTTEARNLAERLRKRIEAQPFTIDTIPPFHKTISIGLSCCPRHFCTAEEMIKGADAALYTAKDLGRNQVVMFNPPSD